METRRVFGVLGVILVVLLVSGAIVASRNSQQNLSPQAVANSVRSGFVSGCDNGGQSTTLTAQQCGCAYDALTAYYNNNPYWAVKADGSETQVYKDIITNGYTTDQTNAVYHCISN